MCPCAQERRRGPVQAAGDPPDDRHRQRARSGRFGEAAREHLLAGAGRPAQAQHAGRTGRLRLEHHEHGRVAIVARCLCEPLEGRSRPILQGAVGGEVGPPDLLDVAADDQVEGGEEALFLVGELLVEGAARDAGQADHLLDAGALIAAAGDGLDHRSVDAGTLMEDDLVAAEPVGPVRQALVQRVDRRGALGPSSRASPRADNDDLPLDFIRPPQKDLSNQPTAVM